jgi:hypothetical protein
MSCRKDVDGVVENIGWTEVFTDFVGTKHYEEKWLFGLGHAMAQAVSRRPLRARVRARVNSVGFVVDKVALGQIFLRVLRFLPCQNHSTVGSTFPKIKKNSSFIHSSIRGRTIGP